MRTPVIVLCWSNPGLSAAFVLSSIPFCAILLNCVMSTSLFSSISGYSQLHPVSSVCMLLFKAPVSICVYATVHSSARHYFTQYDDLFESPVYDRISQCYSTLLVICISQFEPETPQYFHTTRLFTPLLTFSQVPCSTSARLVSRSSSHARLPVLIPSFSVSHLHLVP